MTLFFRYGRICCASFLLVFLFSTGADGFPPFFAGLGDLPGGEYQSRAIGLSADGSTVTGNSSFFPGQSQAFRWTLTDGMTPIGVNSSSAGYCLSDDGSVACGAYAAGGVQAFRWTGIDGTVGLGDLPGGTFYSLTLGSSSDANVLVGQGNSASGTEAFRWVNGSGMTGLGDLPGGPFLSVANGVSGDGSVVVGRSSPAAGANNAFRWTSVGGMVSLGDFPGGNNNSEATAISSNGNVIVGYGTPASNALQAFRWTSGTGMVALGDLPGGGALSTATDVSGDGSVIVGQGDSAIGSEPFVWDQVQGMRSLTQHLQQFGLSGAMTGWVLTEVKGVSDDGLTFTGTGRHQGVTEAWIATVPEPASVAFVMLAVTLLCTRKSRSLR